MLISVLSDKPRQIHPISYMASQHTLNDYVAIFLSWLLSVTLTFVSALNEDHG